MGGFVDMSAMQVVCVTRVQEHETKQSIFKIKLVSVDLGHVPVMYLYHTQFSIAHHY